MRNSGVKFMVMSCAGLVAVAAHAQDRSTTDRRTPAERQNVNRQRSNVDQPFRVEQATSLIGKPVVNQRGESLGQVEELIVDPDHSGRISYVIVSVGDPAGTVSRRSAVPLTAMNLQPDGGQFVMNLSDEQRESFPTFGQDQWPTMDDPVWAARTYEFFGQEPYWRDQAGGTPDDSAVKLRTERIRELIGRSVQNSRGQNMGRVEDFAIDPDTGRIAYNVLTLEGSANSANRYYAVPSNTLQFPVDGRTGIFQADPAVMQNAPSFERTYWPKLADPVYANTVYGHYEQQPYWMQDNQNVPQRVQNNAENPVRNNPPTVRPNSTNPPNSANQPTGDANSPNSKRPTQPKDDNPPREKKQP